MRIYKLFILSALVVVTASAQDTLKVMDWNLLNYVDGSRDQYYRTVIRHVQPDVLVVEEMTSQAMVDAFFNNVVNLVFPGQFTRGTFIDGPDTDNEIYFKTSKFTFIANTPIHTALRNISEFKMYNAVAADTFRIYAAHLKASSGSTNEAARAAEVDSLRRVTNALPDGKYFTFLGDCNIYGSTEQAYQKLLQDNPGDDGNLVDPLTMTGTWNNGAYSPYHTQSTRTRAFGGGATGGLDDRFDLILYSRAVSQPGRIQYLTNSLTPIGNDGNHYNDSINRPPNTAVPDSVANALEFASDHLPVSARFVFRSTTVSRQFIVNNGWNLVSVPFIVPDFRTGVVYPTAISSAYAFVQQSGYVPRDTLTNGVGYWLKFPSMQIVTVTGGIRASDTIEVRTGWNLIGTISYPVLVDSIIQIPPGIVVYRRYFGYNATYTQTDTLQPNQGYWVKVSQDGVLILH